MKELIAFILDFLFKPEPIEMLVELPPIPDLDELSDEEEPPEEIYQEGTFAWVVGHNSTAQGAKNYKGETEFSFSSRICKKAHDKLVALGYKSAFITRPPARSYTYQCNSVAAQCVNHDVKYAILSHFDAFPQVAKGCSFLVRSTEEREDNAMADLATDLLNERFGIRQRHSDGVKTLEPHHNGYGMLNALYNKGVLATIAEPVFANFKTPESKAIFENEDVYVDILVEVAVQCCSGNLK